MKPIIHTANLWRQILPKNAPGQSHKLNWGLQYNSELSSIRLLRCEIWLSTHMQPEGLQYSSQHSWIGYELNIQEEKMGMHSRGAIPA